MLVNMLAIKEQPQQAFVIDPDVLNFRNECDINRHVNQVLNSGIPDWETSDLQEGFERMQDLLLLRLGLKPEYNKGIVTVITRIIDVFKARKVPYELRVPKSLLTSF